MVNYYSLYSTLEGFKRVGTDGSQYIALCPYHQDTKPSFSMNTDIGLHNCKACNVSGNAYQLAKYLGHHNPKEFIDSNGTNYHKHKESGVVTTRSVAKPKEIKKYIDYEELNTAMTHYKQNLKNKWESMDCSKIWNKDLIDELDIGLDNNGDMVYGHHNKEGKLINLKMHKNSQRGDSGKKWYLRHKIASYSKDKELFICEGEKDAICLYNQGYQVTSGTCGAMSIPNLDDIEGFIRYWIPYDKDNWGMDGAKKLAKELLKKNPNAEILIPQWDEQLAEKYDVYDAFMDDIGMTTKMPINIKNAITDTEPFELDKTSTEQVETNKERKGFNMLDLDDFMNKEYKSTEPIIDSLLYKGQTAIIGGATGSKKSMVAIQCALSIASGVPLFNFFQVKQRKVLLIQLEMENKDVHTRLGTMLNHYGQKAQDTQWRNNLKIVEVDADQQDFTNNWDRIEQTLIEQEFSDGVLIVDNIYKSTDKDIQTNESLKELVAEINRQRREYNLDMLLIAHSNKGTSIAKKLDIDQIQGGAVLCSDIANVSMIGNSTLSVDLNILKVVKGGRSEKNELHNIPFKLHWEDETCTHKKGVIIPNEAIHFENMKSSWEIELLKEVLQTPQMMHQDRFTRQEFRDNMPTDKQDWKDYKLGRYLTKMINYGLIKDGGYNKYYWNRDAIQDFVGGK